jgi:ketopantoate reductase
MNIKVLGVGSIGVYLIHAFTEGNHSVSVLDPRFMTNQRILDVQINGESRIINVQSFHQITKSDELIVVTLKSYQIDSKIFSMLTESGKEVLFLQNGISRYLSRDREIERIHYGTILGIQAHKVKEATFINTQDCSIALIPGTEKTQIQLLSKSLSGEALHFANWENSERIYFEKFLRWFISSLVTSVQKKNLGDSLAIMSDDDLDMLITVLVEIVSIESQIGISVESIRLALRNLPPDLLTSAARDFFNAKQSEMQVELDYLIDRSRVLKLDSDVLKSWKERLICV